MCRLWDRCSDVSMQLASGSALAAPAAEGLISHARHTGLAPLSVCMDRFRRRAAGKNTALLSQGNARLLIKAKLVTLSWSFCHRHLHPGLLQGS